MTKPKDRFVMQTLEGIHYPDCFTCMHFNEQKRTCPAFPHGIPDEITQGRVKHRTVRPDQVGDTVYTPEPETKNP